MTLFQKTETFIFLLRLLNEDLANYSIRGAEHWDIKQSFPYSY